MSSFIGEKDRKIVPRWRRFRASIDRSSSETRNIREVASTSLQSNIDDWEREGSLWTALDLVAGAIVENRLDLASSALEHIRTNPLTPPAALEIVEEHERNSSTEIDEDDSLLSVEASCRAQINASRARLGIYPRDAIEWVELSRSFTTLGFLDKAARSMSAALSLAPTDVFVLRAASRLHIQQNDPEHAQWVLTRSPRTLGNPWLLASEIAAASLVGRPSQLIRVARRIEQADFSPKDLTELRAALATAELDAGNNSKGKKLLRRSLDGANENSLAQVQWMDRTRLGNVIDISTIKPPHRHEAAAWRAYFEGKWQKSASCALQWFEDQPFSLNAGIFCSFVLADALERPGEALKVLEIALKSNTENHTLQNNLAYTHILLGDLAKAEAVLNSIRVDPESVEDATVQATMGLLSFRRGDTIQGRELYESAIKTFQRNSVPEQVGRAATYLALEEVRARTEFAVAAVRRALETTKETKRADVSRKLNLLQEGLRGWVNDSEEDSPHSVPHS